MTAAQMIRQFRNEDACACSDIIQTCIEQDGQISSDVRALVSASASPTALAAFSGLYYLAVCELGHRIVGICGLDMNEIRLLYVSPSHHGRGIGGALLEHMESMIPGVLFSDIFVYSARSARSFYRAHGFRAGGEYVFHTSGIPIRTIFMAKPIGHLQFL